MTKLKKLGIWMDHAQAIMIEITNNPSVTKTVDSKFTHQEKEASLDKSEKRMHNKEQHEQSEYYDKLGETILKFDEVVLFGPTDAKLELYNILKADQRFAAIKIEVIQADKMTENQQHAFVREHFQNDFKNYKIIPLSQAAQ